MKTIYQRGNEGQEVKLDLLRTDFETSTGVKLKQWMLLEVDIGKYEGKFSPCNRFREVGDIYSINSAVIGRRDSEKERIVMKSTVGPTRRGIVKYNNSRLGDEPFEEEWSPNKVEVISSEEQLSQFFRKYLTTKRWLEQGEK